jgi:ABC-type phosphate transport system auxiliary subunit
MQTPSPQELFCVGLMKQRELKKKILEQNNKLAEKNDEIMNQRLAARSELQKVLAAFDAETRKLQKEADEETGYHEQISTTSKELQTCNESLATLLEVLGEEPAFTYTNDEASIIITKTTEKRSAGISLKSISQALQKAKIFESAAAAEQIIKVNNTVDVPILKIKDSITGQTLDLDKELPKPTKRSRN